MIIVKIMFDVSKKTKTETMIIERIIDLNPDSKMSTKKGSSNFLKFCRFWNNTSGGISFAKNLIYIKLIFLLINPIWFVLTASLPSGVSTHSIIFLSNSFGLEIGSIGLPW